MYEYIQGQFMGIFKDYVVVDHQGIGYKIFASGNTMSHMPAMGESVRLYLRQIVREDFLGLYGFIDREELALFDLFLTVTGVGAKSALSLLSIATPDNIKKAIAFEDEVLLIRAQGIGKKTAQRIILELKDKFKKEGMTPPDRDVQISISQTEALEALLALGYTQNEANRVLKTVKGDLSVEETIKQALQSLMS